MPSVDTDSWFDLDWQTGAFIGGAYDEGSPERIEVSSPVNGRRIADMAACGKAEVDRAVALSRESFESGAWSRSAPAVRKRTLFSFAERIEAETEFLARTMSVDAGKPISDSRAEVAISVRFLRFFAESVDKVYGEEVPVGPGGLATVTREPVGVVAAVVPWNYPLLMPMWKIAPALAAGNSLILKPAEQASLVAIQLGRLAAEAGIPDGVFNVLPGAGPVTGQALGLHLDVDKVAFTGSTATGKRFLEYAGASNLKSVTLECGGKSAAIILDDAPEMDVIAAMTAEGIFANAGQVCNAGSRVLVSSRRRDEFLSTLADEAAKWEPSDPFQDDTRMGSLIDQVQMEKVISWIGTGSREGGKVVVGGERTRIDTGGYYVQPTVLSEVTPAMTVANEEIFGPVLAVSEFADEEEAVRIANGTKYGLAAGVWTRDISRAHRIARALRAGSVYVNCWDFGGDNLPFGGYKSSGIGRDKSLHSIDEYTELKSTFVNLDA